MNLATLLSQCSKHCIRQPTCHAEWIPWIHKHHRRPTRSRTSHSHRSLSRLCRELCCRSPSTVRSSRRRGSRWLPHPQPRPVPPLSTTTASPAVTPLTNAPVYACIFVVVRHIGTGRTHGCRDKHRQHRPTLDRTRIPRHLHTPIAPPHRMDLTAIVASPAAQPARLAGVHHPNAVTAAARRSAPATPTPASHATTTAGTSTAIQPALTVQTAVPATSAIPAAAAAA
ncbi:hypothetical protein BC831DRAFT_73543 [Entophlyctis helioformis]|nr:hypothetical protein BC831DRAFT_73543 [Entophlyctis helioformis]